MLRYAATRDAAAASGHLSLLLRTPAPDRFQSRLQRLHERFRIYAATSPEPLPAAGLVINNEIRRQCELYLPLEEIKACFYRLYRESLTYEPILSSTPFHHALSWADVHAALPAEFRKHADPARLLEMVLTDETVRQKFLFHSFLPQRFYGGFRRYPAQYEFLLEWLKAARKKRLRCLDAAGGTGEGVWDLARLLRSAGYAPEQCAIEGWTIEPLEVWVASHGKLPHDPVREAAAVRYTADLFATGWNRSARFGCVDLREHDCNNGECYDLIVCNGLFGGPILHRPPELRRVAANLAGMLAPGGVVLVADRFHDGWKKNCPQENLRAVFEAFGLATDSAGEGIAGLKLHQQPAP